MNRQKYRIVHVTTQSPTTPLFTLAGGRILVANTPEAFYALANRGADLIVHDLNIGAFLLRFAEVLSAFRHIPLMAVGGDSIAWNKVAGNTHIESH